MANEDEQDAAPDQDDSLPNREKLERALEPEFSEVRVHSRDPDGDESVGVQGLTQGDNITMGRDPGLRVLAHELAHKFDSSGS